MASDRPSSVTRSVSQLTYAVHKDGRVEWPYARRTSDESTNGEDSALGWLVRGEA